MNDKPPTTLNQSLDIAAQFQAPANKQASLEQDNVNKTAFALGVIQRIPVEPPKVEEPRIPSLGAMAVPN